MALTIRPQEGITIDKTEGIDITSDVYKNFVVTNTGTSEMYLEYPDPSTLQGIEIVNDGELRSPLISPGGGELTITVRVRREYVNSLDEPGLFKQILQLKAVGYENPPPPPPPGPQFDYYSLNISPTQGGDVIIDQYTYLFDIYVTMLGIDGAETSRVLPENGYNIEPKTEVSQEQLTSYYQEPLDDGRTRIRFRNFDPVDLNSTYIISPRGSTYLDAAGNPVSTEVNFYVDRVDDTVVPPDDGTNEPTGGEGPTEPTDTGGSGGSGTDTTDREVTV